jgi:hypothetical protein
MSRSYRKPYAAVCGCDASAKKDKQLAHRGVRRVQNWVAKKMLRDPDLEMPHFRSCPWNDVYDWSRDGGKRLEVPTAREWSDHVKAVLGLGYFVYPWMQKHYLEWPPKQYAELTRK